MPNTNTNRIEALDYFRGLMALVVMLYHYTVWSGAELQSDSMLSKLGLYAVSIFYILSGLTLGIIYGRKISSKEQVYSFFIKRLFRIVPLFWLSVFAVVAINIAKGLLPGGSIHIDHYQLLLNLTLLFSFFDPAAYMSTGAWSIGNEIVFYSLFPFVVLVAAKSRAALPLVLVVSISLGLLFSQHWISADRELVDQWSIYVNPLNQLFLFVSGVALAFYVRPDAAEGNRTAAPGMMILLAATAVFAAVPSPGDRVGLVVDDNRILLSLACIAVVYGLYISGIKFKSGLNQVLNFLGEACYSIYLLHPIVVLPLAYLARKIGLGPLAIYPTAAVLTLLISYFTFTYIERPMMRAGGQVAARVGQGKP